MFKFVAVLLLAAQASAFVAPRAARSQMTMKVDLVGSSAPLGFFDPLGLSKTNPKTLAAYRESELKHGRTAMLAVLGWLAQEKWHPLYDGKLSGNPLKAAFETPSIAFVQILLFGGFLEWIFESSKKRNANYQPGNYFGINADPADPSWVDFQTRELNNGRLAMFAIVGEIYHAQLTGQGALEQIGF